MDTEYQKTKKVSLYYDTFLLLSPRLFTGSSVAYNTTMDCIHYCIGNLKAVHLQGSGRNQVLGMIKSASNLLFCLLQPIKLTVAGHWIFNNKRAGRACAKSLSSPNDLIDGNVLT